MWMEVGHAILLSLLESAVFVVVSINQSDIAWMEVFINTVNSGEINSLINIPSQQIYSIAFMHQVNKNGITLRYNLITINQIG